MSALPRHGQRVRLTPEAIEAINQLPLKGNVRELRSLLERTVLIAPQGAAITPEAVKTLVMRQTKIAGLADAWASCLLDEEMKLLRAKSNSDGSESSTGARHARCAAIGNHTSEASEHPAKGDIKIYLLLEHL